MLSVIINAFKCGMNTFLLVSFDSSFIASSIDVLVVLSICNSLSLSFVIIYVVISYLLSL